MEGKRYVAWRCKTVLVKVKENETLLKRTADKGEKEVLAIAKEMGLEFTAEELKEAGSICELDLSNMERIAGGLAIFRPVAPDIDRSCKRDPSGQHKWFFYYHYEHEYFNFLKEGGLWSRGFDVYKCALCGQQKEEETWQPMGNNTPGEK